LGAIECGKLLIYQVEIGLLAIGTHGDLGFGIAISIHLLLVKLICLGRGMASFFRLDVRGGEKPGFFQNS
jgi:hypothetical protein